MTGGTETAFPARVTTRDDASRLVDGVLTIMGELERVLEHETGHLRGGRIREGLSQEVRKTELASAYLRGLESVKSNAVALARFAPEALERLKGAHGRFSRVVELNQTVLATARAVSENLVKSVAEEMSRTAKPQGYAPGRLPAPQAGRAEPLVVSKSL